MRKLARVLTIVTMAVLGALILLLAGTGLRASVTGTVIQSAADQPAVFETIANAITSGDMGSDQFKRVSEPDPARYQLITYRVSVRNAGLLGADWVRLKLTPEDADVALLAATADVGPFGSAEVTATLMTEAGGDARREIWVEYYVLGSHLSSAAPWAEKNG